MAKWNVGTESGILRKKVVKENHDDLLVFGYACKLFRDDEKALFIDQGKHLIPWMGEDALKIDRYDCRGALSELLQYEANREDYDTTRWLGLSESERRIEVLCDEERYYSLKNNDEELEMYKEEELKRLHQKGSEVQYNYDVPSDPDNSQDVPEAAEQEDDQVFVPPPELDVPDDMKVPKTIKEHARIEKTAMFVHKQGLQMEILIKTKQADNPQFNFLNKDDPLYKYYKHLVTVIKSGQYKGPPVDTNAEEKLDDSSEQDGHEDHYLHPSLLATSLQLAPPPLPTVIYKPSADCTYSQLVNRIQGTQSESATPPPPPQQPPPPPEVPQAQVTYDQQQQYYQQYYYAAQYYEYYKQMTQQYQGQNVLQAQDKMSQESPAFAQGHLYAPNPSAAPQFNMQNLMQTQAAYMQYLQQQAVPNPYAQIVSNLSHAKEAPPAPYVGFPQPEPTPVVVPPAPVPVQNSDITKAPILYSQNEPTQPVLFVATPTVVVAPVQPPTPDVAPPTPNASDKVLCEADVVAAAEPIANKDEVVKPAEPKPTKEALIIKKPLLSLAQYGSDSENEEASEDEPAGNEEVKVPPGETQQIIDKMASYVLKNGSDFENIVKSKGDPRFEFLHEQHEYHPYYRLKINEGSGKTSPIVVGENGETKEVKEQHNGTANKPKEKKIITPVSFSIKKSKDEAKEIKSALPVEESDDDQEDEAPPRTPPIASPILLLGLPTVAPSLLPTPTTPKHRPISRTPPPRIVYMVTAPQPDVLTERLQDNTKSLVEEETRKRPSEIEIKTKAIVESADDLILEMIDLTDDLEERRETRRVADRKKDKIAAAAREKLALQLERKKKAAAFLKLKSVESTKSDASGKSDGKSERSSKRSGKRDRDNSSSSAKKGKTSKTKDKVEVDKDGVLKVDDSESEEGEIKKHKKSSKKKKSHKRKHSKSRHESKNRHKNKEHKKSKKRRKRSDSCSSHSSATTQ